MSKEYETFMREAAKRRAAIMRLHRKEVSQTEIAKRLGMSRQRVHQVINQSKKDK